MKDTIYRQDAIDAVAELVSSMSVCISVDECHGMKRMQGMAVRALDNLPSAQPEIIRCKDCRWGREACGNIECFADTNVPPEYHGYDWFCGNAERRTDDEG